ncbi:unknown protein [Seminavis robusta]|uniref:Uncharacterized protein n=1 Tax=Seminavis robusta TaxID=568900 RepID=A0A9N8EF63_9STRA|nr:unknown protein [Seminavis robusta]|eukprot:Sro1005_g230220.1 n/a (124) ;mRNA; f:11979-12350
MSNIFLSGWMTSAAAKAVHDALENIGAEIKMEGNVMTVAFNPEEKAKAKDDDVDNVAAQINELDVNGEGENDDSSRTTLGSFSEEEEVIIPEVKAKAYKKAPKKYDSDDYDDDGCFDSQDMAW